jgi:hypothetical protein
LPRRHLPMPPHFFGWNRAVGTASILYVQCALNIASFTA